MIRDIRHISEVGKVVTDFRYDEGIRIREEKVCPTLTIMSGRGMGENSFSGYPLLIEVTESEDTNCDQERV